MPLTPLLGGITVLLGGIAVGAGAGPLLRAQILYHAVPSGEPWRTTCPACAGALSRRRVPALPWTGRCPRCTARIGPPVGTVEALGAVLGAAVAWRAAASLPAAVPAAATVLAATALVWAALIGIALTFVDVAVHRLPDRFTGAAAGGTLLALTAATVAGAPAGRLLSAIAAALLAGGFYFVLVFVRSGMGFGDAKAAVPAGLATGWFGLHTAVLAVVAGLVLAGFVATVLLLTGRVSRHDRLAHGPFLLGGALLAVLLPHR